MKKVVILIIAVASLIICMSGCYWGNFIFPYPLVEPSVYYQEENSNNSDKSSKVTDNDTISDEAKDKSFDP